MVIAVTGIHIVPDIRTISVISFSTLFPESIKKTIDDKYHHVKYFFKEYLFHMMAFSKYYS